MCSLSKKMREEMKQPMGKLVDEEGLIEYLKKHGFFVCIGDIVTYTCLKYGLEPVFCVVDYKTRRGPVSDEIEELIKNFGKKSIRVQNPAGGITDDLWNIIKFAYENLEKGSLRIEIEGEEDMASLAAIYLAPSDVTIIYGLPDKGVLVITPTSENKKKVKEVLDKM